MGWKNVKKDADDKMKKTIEHFQHEMSTIRTGRATPSLLDSVKVEYYGSKVPINQVGSVSTPEPRLLMVQPWDKGAIQAIEKGILEADLGLNPANDGQVIRIPIPELSGERRNDLVKLVKKLAEDSRVSLRNIRRDANDSIKKLEKSHEISEDQMQDGLSEIQELTNDHIKEIEKLLVVKEKEVLED